MEILTSEISSSKGVIFIFVNEICLEVFQYRFEKLQNLSAFNMQLFFLKNILMFKTHKIGP